MSHANSKDGTPVIMAQMASSGIPFAQAAP
jgi:hypothetical protein